MAVGMGITDWITLDDDGGWVRLDTETGEVVADVFFDETWCWYVSANGWAFECESSEEGQRLCDETLRNLGLLPR